MTPLLLISEKIVLCSLENPSDASLELPEALLNSLFLQSALVASPTPSYTPRYLGRQPIGRRDREVQHNRRLLPLEGVDDNLDICLGSTNRK
ncbi:hypothetical protein TNIN_275041 [Trichonephila inaurata madagascariensis]|uniref:Uncharacterized protein n=1 Tax=Trichonephila inaurata madagascariensis TaxID=2747483 RepID=A0A8X6WY35_9ARAC|nr:hypothetical protein TNIN_275041 [Trichonephila inaurata madagascariensis]